MGVAIGPGSYQFVFLIKGSAFWLNRMDLYILASDFLEKKDDNHLG